MYLDDRRAVARRWHIQNASVPQLTSLLTDPDMTAIPHQKTFLDLVNHKDAWVTPDDLGLPADQRRPRAAPSAPSPPVAPTRRRPLDDLAGQLQTQLDANGPQPLHVDRSRVRSARSRSIAVRLGPCTGPPPRCRPRRASVLIDRA